VKALLVVHSYHHGNTKKVAQAIAELLDAEIKHPAELGPEDLDAYELVGFGSGIDSERHYRPLLEFAESLLERTGRRAFIFSTCGLPQAFAKGEAFQTMIRKNHATLREIIERKGFKVLGDFACVGHNSNSFLKYFGGLNKGRPDARDLEEARAFARSLDLGALT